MNTINNVLPTTSLPETELTLNDLKKLGLKPPELDLLQGTAKTIGHVVRHGNHFLLSALAIEQTPPVTLTLEQLDIILKDPELTREVQKYAALSFNRELQRQCREIISGLRLYWFTRDTVVYLMERTNLGFDERGQVLSALARLGKAIDQGLDPLLLGIRGELESPDVRRDPANSNCTVVNQHQLQRILAHGQIGTYLDEHDKHLLSVLLEVVDGLT